MEYQVIIQHWKIILVSTSSILKLEDELTKTDYLKQFAGHVKIVFRSDTFLSIFLFLRRNIFIAVIDLKLADGLTSWFASGLYFVFEMQTSQKNDGNR